MKSKSKSKMKSEIIGLNLTKKEHLHIRKDGD